jgi:hypothetical protein
MIRVFEDSKYGRGGVQRIYRNHCETHVPGKSAGYRLPRTDGGKRSGLLWDYPEWLETHESADFAGNFDYSVDQGRPPVQFSVVPSTGKSRGITMCVPSWDILMPLHKTIYDVITGGCNSWCVRGEVTTNDLPSFEDGRVYVSGDYESATDNLPILVQEELLKTFVSLAGIPEHVSDLAIRSLRTEIHVFDRRGNLSRTVVHRRGQLMGSPLSFPFLCLQNLCAATFSLPKSVVPSIRINGDDIVFLARRGDFEVWANTVGSLGLKLSLGKTIVHERFVTMNSTFFFRGAYGVKELDTFKLGMLTVRKPEDASDYVNRLLHRWYSGSDLSLRFMRRLTQRWLAKSHKSLVEPRPFGCELNLPIEAFEVGFDKDTTCLEEDVRRFLQRRQRGARIPNPDSACRGWRMMERSKVPKCYMPFIGMFNAMHAWKSLSIGVRPDQNAECSDLVHGHHTPVLRCYSDGSYELICNGIWSESSLPGTSSDPVVVVRGERVRIRRMMERALGFDPSEPSVSETLIRDWQYSSWRRGKNKDDCVFVPVYIEPTRDINVVEYIVGDADEVPLDPGLRRS